MGIDSGTLVAGYSIMEENGNMLNPLTYGVIKAGSKLSFPERLHKIYYGLSEVIEKYKPTEIAIEEIFYGKNIKAAIRIGEGRGVAILTAAEANIPVTEYAATVVKKSVTGTGGASKKQVQEMVKIILNLSEIPKPADAADALAIAICHCHRYRLQKII